MKSEFGNYDAYLKEKGAHIAEELRGQIESNRLRKLEDARMKHKQGKMEREHFQRQEEQMELEKSAQK